MYDAAKRCFGACSRIKNNIRRSLMRSYYIGLVNKNGRLWIEEKKRVKEALENKESSSTFIGSLKEV